MNVRAALFLRHLMVCVAAVLCASCSSASTTVPGQNLVQQLPDLHAAANALQTPALVAVNARRGALEFWPILLHGSNNPQSLSGPLGIGYASMAADGHVLATANEHPSEVVLYNVDTQHSRTLPDPYGTPVDIAIDKNHNIFVVNLTSPGSNVTMYPAGTRQPKEFVCGRFDFGEAIAVDNEGDIFVHGYHGGFIGVFEIPNGPGGPEPQNCMRLALKNEPGYPGGIAVDPKTDDLIVLDDPGTCAGGPEGRMTIYPKPYQKQTGRSRLIGTSCSGTIRLNADSTIIFVSDTDVCECYSVILQRSYPDGRDLGRYGHGDPAGFTTIPNTLPN